MIDNIFEAVVKPVLKFLGVHSPFIFGVIINVFIISIFCKLVDAFEVRAISKLREKNSDSPLVNLTPVLIKIVKVIVIFLLLAGFLQSFGYNVSSLIAGFGITGLAVGFAAKEAIGNIFGSVGLLADRVYKIGDYIKFSNLEGYVERINLRSTSIRTLDNFVVNVPNNTIANQAITNVSQAKKRLIDITVGVEYGTSNEKLDRAVQILKEIAHDSENITGDGVFTSIESLGDSSINVRLFSYTPEITWFKYKQIKGAVIREIIHRYRAEGISFAFPSVSVYKGDSDSEN
ncbi:mechanosensitive ion channel family protein [bacterium]|nr:mechanosensitive ion channel family protein [bacterium]